MDVGVSRFERLHLRVTLVGARASSRARVDRGRVVYEGAFAHTDRVITASASQLEELLVLRDHGTPRAFSWSIETPPGITRVDPTAGGFVFRDAADRPVLTMHAPHAFDANGANLPLRSTWDPPSHTFTLLLPEKDELAFPVVVDPDFETSVWLSIDSRTPPPRTNFGIAYDSARSEVVVFGGFANVSRLSDTWVWNGTLWAQRTPSVSPAPRSDFAMAYDSARNEVVMFGGTGESGPAYLDDTWVWNGANWAQRMPAAIPPGRASHALAFDSARGEVVMFGGRSSTTLDDTWVWNGVTWAERTPANPPPARTLPALAYDSAHGEVVLFGGAAANSVNLTDTWLWNGARWVERTPATRPSAGGPLVYDRLRGEIVMLVGRGASATVAETWAWDGTTWAPRATPASLFSRFGHGMAFDEARGQTIAFGGRIFATGLSVSDTWSWDGATWLRRAPSPTPISRINHAMAFDRARGEVVLFGGAGVSLGPPLYNDTWTWNGFSWTERTPAVSPTARAQHSLAYDSKNGVTLLFGGSSTNDTWAWNGTSWAPRTPPASPPARFSGAMTFDEANGVTVLFGGYLGSVYRNDVWTWNGDAWNEMTPATGPVGRAYHALAFDPAHHDVLLFGGVTSSVVLRDTWTWNGNAWSSRMTAAAPVARFGHALAPDAVSGEILLFGGAPSISGSPLDDTWGWNGLTWARRAPTSPQPRRSHAMAADTTRNQIVLFGGYGAGFSGSLNDTWLYATLGGRCAKSADCIDAASCVDGVCCNAPSCGPCRTCAGTSPGQCTPVLNREDPDSCAEREGKSCSDLGECKITLGAPAIRAQDCASGFLVDGVCCATASCDVCQTCATGLKERADVTGHCTASRTGTDPHDECADEGAGSCGHDGQCDGATRCAFYPQGTPCGAPGAACSGAGKCVAAAEGSCDGDHIVVAADGTRTDCSPYRCAGSTCRTGCASVNDCVTPNVCTSRAVCVDLADPGVTLDGCSCDMSTRPSTPSIPACLLSLFAFVSRRRRTVGS